MTTNHTGGKTAAPPARLFRIILSCFLALAVLLVLFVLGLGYYAAFSQKAESAWRAVPPDAAAVIEAYDAPALLAALRKDGGLDAVLAALRRRDPDVDLILRDNGIALSRVDDRIFEYIERYFSLNSWLRAAVTPKTILAGIRRRDGEAVPFGVVQIPVWFDVYCFFLPYAEGTIHPFAVGGSLSLYAARHNGWLVFSPSEAVVESIVENWETPNPLFGDSAGSGKPCLKAVVCAGAGRDAQPAAPAKAGNPDNPFLAGLPALDFENAGEDDWSRLAGGQLRVLVELTDPAWKIGKLWLSDADKGDGSGVFVPDEGSYPPPASGMAIRAGKAAEFAFSLPGESVDFRDMLDKAATVPDPARDDVLASLAWLWARWGWLEHCSGRFILHAGAPPERASLVRPKPAMPMFALGWTTRGDHALARREFEESLELLLSAAAAPGGRVVLEGIKNLLTRENFATPSGSGAYLDLPGLLTYWTYPAWYMSTPQGEAPGTGFLATDPACMPVNGAAHMFDWPGFSAPGPSEWADRFALAGAWQLTGAFTKNLHAIVDEFIPTVAYFKPVYADRIGLANFLAKKMLPHYPRGSISAWYDPSSGNAAANIVVGR